ncbi:unnamed protein product [Staurois parvus]|uniref:Uncharacterized protein n=1 Tax=Staurois parvus TaxID=386267 RepID=A0ABN9D6Q2_9NEOB|nr:unnamed protein product [Staurois parvus]
MYKFSFNNKNVNCLEKKKGIIHLDAQSSCDDMYSFTNTCQSCKK